MASEMERASERRLKFSTVGRLESQTALQHTPGAVPRMEPARRGAPLTAIGGILTAAYVAVARKLLLGLEAVQDGRAARRAVALRRSARANAASSARSDALSPSARSNSLGDDLL